jgi:hypothetical protein
MPSDGASSSLSVSEMSTDVHEMSSDEMSSDEAADDRSDCEKQIDESIACAGNEANDSIDGGIHCAHAPPHKKQKTSNESTHRTVVTATITKNMAIRTPRWFVIYMKHMRNSCVHAQMGPEWENIAHTTSGVHFTRYSDITSSLLQFRTTAAIAFYTLLACDCAKSRLLYMQRVWRTDRMNLLKNEIYSDAVWTPAREQMQFTKMGKSTPVYNWNVTDRVFEIRDA